MAAPITHIVLAEKIYKKYFDDKDKKRFMIGTSFPDIRYLGVIDRQKTHFNNLRMNEIVTEESFTAGLKFHSMVDEVRETYVVSKGIYDLMPQSKFITQALKFLEDTLLYDQISDWTPYINYFDEVLKKLSLEVKQDDIKLWHDILKNTFSAKPTPEGVTEFVKMIGKPSEMSDEINRVVSIIKEDERLISYVKSLYDVFDLELTQYEI